MSRNSPTNHRELSQEVGQIEEDRELIVGLNSQVSELSAIVAQSISNPNLPQTLEANGQSMQTDELLNQLGRIIGTIDNTLSELNRNERQIARLERDEEEEEYESEYTVEDVSSEQSGEEDEIRSSSPSSSASSPRAVSPSKRRRDRGGDESEDQGSGGLELGG